MKAKVREKSVPVRAREHLGSPDLAAARKIGVGRIRMVTLTGDTVEGSGVMSGGSSKRRSSFVQTDVIEKCEKVAAELADQESVAVRGT